MPATATGLIVEHDDARPRFQVVAAVGSQVGAVGFLCRAPAARLAFRRHAVWCFVTDAMSVGLLKVAVPRRYDRPIPAIVERESVTCSRAAICSKR